MSSESVEVVKRLEVASTTEVGLVPERASRRDILQYQLFHSRVVLLIADVWRGDTKDGHISQISDSFQPLQEVQLALRLFPKLRPYETGESSSWLGIRRRVFYCRGEHHTKLHILKIFI